MELVGDVGEDDAVGGWSDIGWWCGEVVEILICFGDEATLQF